MLSWLSGPAPSDQQADYADTTAFQDQPDTPAHVFAARAFKYRLWGTPKPGSNPPKQPARARSNEERPRLPHSRSDDMVASPSKPNGILLTPGTTNLRRSKTVTFPKRLWEDDDKPGSKTAVVVPGKFPSPSKIDLTAIEEVPSTKSRTKFTERLQSVRTTSAVDTQKSSQTSQPAQSTTVNKPTPSQSDPADHTDWKLRYEQYSARTEREMRKLIAKQQAAKHYAREKDARATSLAEQLRAERKRTAKLEAQVQELQAQLQQQQQQPEKTLEQRFSAIRPTTSPAKQRRPPPRDAAPDIWTAPATPPSGPARGLLQPRHANAAESHTPKATPPRVSVVAAQGRRSVAPAMHDELDASLDLPAPSPDAVLLPARGVESSPFVSTPERRPERYGAVGMGQSRVGDVKGAEKENAPPEEVKVLESPRKALDAERRAKAAARIAARRLEREKRGRGRV